MNILIVEDEALLAMALQDVLEEAGHKVVGMAPSQTEALRLLEQDGSRPDLALMDINLLDGAGVGVDLARRLQQAWGVPSLFVSAQASEARANRDAALGFVDKPWDPQTMLDSVEAAQQVLEGSRPPRVPAGLELFDGRDGEVG